MTWPRGRTPDQPDIRTVSGPEASNLADGWSTEDWSNWGQLLERAAPPFDASGMTRVVCQRVEARSRDRRRLRRRARVGACLAAAMLVALGVSWKIAVLGERGTNPGTIADQKTQKTSRVALATEKLAVNKPVAAQEHLAVPMDTWDETSWNMELSSAEQTLLDLQSSAQQVPAAVDRFQDRLDALEAEVQASAL